MSIVHDARSMIAPRRGARDGPLAPLLLGLTWVTGVVDAFSFLALGHVFVANATGNVVFLAFALAGAHGFSIAASALALAAFSAGGVAGGRAIRVASGNRGRLLALAVTAEAGFAAAALAVTQVTHQPATGAERLVLIAIMAPAMGIQNAIARRLAVSDLTTTVLTLTLTGIAADSKLAGGPGSRLGRRLPPLALMFAGALVGSWLVVSGRGRADLIIVLLALLAVAGIAQRSARANPPWARLAPSAAPSAAARTR